MAKSKISTSIKNFNTMIKYCEESTCRHYLLAREFGDDIPDCRKCCDVCTNAKLVSQKISAFKGTFLGSKFSSQKACDNDNDLYGGGRAGARKDYEDFGKESGEEDESREKSAKVALSNLISEEFEKRRGCNKEKNDKFKRTSSTKVLQPSLNKIPEVSLILREKYFDKLVEEIESHLKSCASNNHCPKLNEKQIRRCAAETEWNVFSSKGNIHMYRREIVNLTKSFREASRQVEVHPIVTKFITSSESSQNNAKNAGKERLHTLVDYFAKQRQNNASKTSEVVSSSVSFSDSPRVASISSLSPPESNNKRSRTSIPNHCDNTDAQKSSSRTFHDTDSDRTDGSPRKYVKSKHSGSSHSSIEEEKPMMKYFFDSVCSEASAQNNIASPIANTTKDAHMLSPKIKTMERTDMASVKRLFSAGSPSKSKRKKTSNSPDTDRTSHKSEKAKTTSQIRNDNLKKAADLVRKHLNPEYKSKRISKDFFKIVCRSISHRLVEADCVNDTAARVEVEKLLQSHEHIHEHDDTECS